MIGTMLTFGAGIRTAVQWIVQTSWSFDQLRPESPRPTCGAAANPETDSLFVLERSSRCGGSGNAAYS